MARPRNRIPSYLRHQRSGQARVRIHGRDIYLGRFGSPESKEAYARLIAEHFANGESESVTVPGGEKLTIAALVVKYDDFAKSYYVKNGHPTDERYAIKAAVGPLVNLYGSTPADEFGPKRLKAIRQEMVSRGRKRDGHALSRKYVNYRTACIVRIFRWAVEEELVPAAVYQSLKAVVSLQKGRVSAVRESKPVKPVPEEHIRPVLEEVWPQVGAMIRLQLLTGMRPDEATIMRPCDIDRRGDLWVYRPSSHKTEHHNVEKAVFLGPRAQEIIEPWLDREPTAYLFNPREVREAVLASRRTGDAQGSPRRPRGRQPMTRLPRDHYDDETYCQAVERACERAGVPKWTPGRLRHNAGTYVRKMFGAEAAQLVLGHRNLSTTEIYAEKDRKRYEEIARAIG